MNRADLPRVFHLRSCLQSLHLAYNLMLVNGPLGSPLFLVFESNKAVCKIINALSLWRHMTKGAVDNARIVQSFSGRAHLQPLPIADLRILRLQRFVYVHLADVQARQGLAWSDVRPDVLRDGDGHVAV